MPNILQTPIENYLNEMLPQRDPVTAEMERYAQKHSVPIVGPACARVLFQQAQMISAKRIFEMGSAIGYSTLWLARAVGPGGSVFYTDSDPENIQRAKGYLTRAGLLRRVTFLLGDALESLRQTRGEFDLIFNDVSKIQYPEAFRLALPRIRRGGLFITDNVLWSGRVAGGKSSRDKSTEAIRKFNRIIYRQRNLLTTIVPLRDGLAICLKQ